MKENSTFKYSYRKSAICDVYYENKEKRSQLVNLPMPTTKCTGNLKVDTQKIRTQKTESYLLAD